MTTSEPRPGEGRDELDAKVADKLRALRLQRPVPAPTADEPSDEDLLRYVEGVLAAAEHGRVEARIAASPYATARVAIVVEALRECGFPVPPKQATRLAERPVRYVFRMVQEALTFLRGSDLPAGLAPALALRGAPVAVEPGFFEFTHQFGAVAARLQVERVPERGVEIALTLVEAERPIEGARVTLKRLGPGEPAGRALDSAATEDGRASFSDLAPARYQLEIRRGGVELGHLRVDVLGE